MAPTQEGTVPRTYAKTTTRYQTSGGPSYNMPPAAQYYTESQWRRADEKRCLQDINDRFEAYMKRVSELANQQGSQGSLFMSTIRNVEDSVSGLKAAYEREIDELRCQIQGAGSEKAEWSAALNGLQQRNNHLSSELAVEKERGDKLACQANDLIAQNNMLTKDANDLHLKIRELEAAMSRQADDHGNLHLSYSDLHAQLDDLTRRLENEQRLRHEADETNKQLQNKLDFHIRMKDQELVQMLSRLDGSSSVIYELENKLHDMTENEAKVPELLRRVREAAEEDLKRFKTNAEVEFNAKLATLKDKYADDARQLADLKAENDRLNATITDLQGQINTLRSQFSGLQQEREGLIASMADERKQNADQIRELQNKVEALNEMYIKCIQEVNLDGDHKISLQPEIESLLVLLEGEEKRIVSNAQPIISEQAKCVGHPTQKSAGAFSGTYGASDPRTQYGSAHGHAQHDYTCREQPCAEHHFQQVQSVGPVSTVIQSRPPEVRTRLQSEADLAKLEVNQRSQSAQASTEKRAIMPRYLGQGRDYFDSMFNDLKRTHLAAGDEVRPQSSTSHEQHNATNSQTGELCIHEVHPLGQYIRIHNTSEDKEVDMSSYQIQQNVGGRPVAIFRFPAKTKVAPNATATVWCADVDSVCHQPPTDFICPEQQKWGTGPECTTILCKANGQAVAWCTASHRISRDAYAERAAVSPAASDQAKGKLEDPPLTELPPKAQIEPVFLQREKMEQPSFVPKRHPHGQDPMESIHPNTNTARQKTMGNDNSSFNRQSRVPKSPVPDPVPVLYSGAAASRLGASPLRKPTIRGNGRLINKPSGTIIYGPPSPFLSSLQQDYIRSKNPSLVPQ